MEMVMYTDESVVSNLGQKFCRLREEGKLLDLRITTNDGNHVEAHRLVVAAAFPNLLKTLTSQSGEVVVQWRRFSKDIVEAAINYAYTGSIAISAENVLRNYLLAHNLGSATIVEWCLDFLRTGTSLDNVAEVWSAANATLNRELVELCIPLIERHFETLCLQGEMLTQTTVKHFEVLLERIRQGGMSEETKFRAISKWLDSGRTEYDVKERADAFTKIISKIDLPRLSSPIQTEYWEIVRKHFEWIKPMPHPSSNYPSRCREVIMIIGKDTVSGAFVLKSVPQLQPDESFNVKVPSHDTLTVLNGTFFDFDLWDVESRLWSVNYRNGCVCKIPFRGEKRTSYSVATRNESIFIFGGYKGDDVVPTCEKVDTTTGEFTRLPDMPSSRSRTSTLNIPDIGIIVVGGWTAYRLNFAELLVEDPSHKSGWRWMRLSPMLEGREEPGIAYINGCVVVAGGQYRNVEITVEGLTLTSVEQPTAQWTRLHGVDKLCTHFTSLVAFNNKLIMLTSDGPEGVVHEFSPTEGDNSLANFTWKPLFRMDNLSEARILVTIERLDGS